MAKPHDTHEKTKETHPAKEAHAAPHGAKDGHAQGDAKHPDHKKGEAPQQPKAKAAVRHPDGCHALDCKTKPVRFNFCEEHFEQFKFGLIKKTGEPVPDYEKKYEHYLAYQARLRAQKAA